MVVPMMEVKNSGADPPAAIQVAPATSGVKSQAVQRRSMEPAKYTSQTCGSKKTIPKSSLSQISSPKNDRFFEVGEKKNSPLKNIQPRNRVQSKHHVGHTDHVEDRQEFAFWQKLVDWLVPTESWVGCNCFQKHDSDFVNQKCWSSSQIWL